MNRAPQERPVYSLGWNMSFPAPEEPPVRP